MALQENLTEENVNDLKKVFNEKIAPENPEAVFRQFNTPEDDRQRLLEENVASLKLQVSELTAYLQSVFDGHFLIDGRFIKLNV